MEYIEELESGDVFVSEDKVYLLTCDFKSSGDRLCFCLKTGLPKWFGASTIVSINPVYSLDNNNNIVPVKESKKHDSSNNIS
jgi:hypothetical protein